MGRESRPTRLYQAQSLDDGRIVVDLPQFGNDPIARVAMVDVDVGRTLVSSADASGFVVSDEEDSKAQIDPGIEVRRSRRLVPNGVVAPSPLPERSVVLRLLASNGRLLAIVPVATQPRRREIIRD